MTLPVSKHMGPNKNIIAKKKLNNTAKNNMVIRINSIITYIGLIYLYLISSSLSTKLLKIE